MYIHKYCKMSVQSSNEQQTQETQVEQGSNYGKYIGCVKWFNRKAGYGFITTMESEQRDIFVHHSVISVSKQQYRYLVEGEYISFDILDATIGEYSHVASNVRGVNGGRLLCEVHRPRISTGGRKGGRTKSSSPKQTTE